MLTLTGAPRVATGKVKLPIKLVVKPVLPVKNAEYKLTLDSNKPPCNLNDIFPGKYYYVYCMQNISCKTFPCMFEKEFFSIVKFEQ